MYQYININILYIDINLSCININLLCININFGAQLDEVMVLAEKIKLGRGRTGGLGDTTNDNQRMQQE